jgi:hypothetical protein
VLQYLSQVINPARWTELRAFFGANATFKSRHQAIALEFSARREKDLFVLLGTGGGKSQMFMSCAVNADEAQLTTIVVVPFIALDKDLVIRLTAKKIRVAEWSQTVGYYSAQVTIVMSETAASDAFLAYFLKGCQDKKIARLVLDEIHTLLTDAHYRPLLRYMSELRQGGVQFIRLSANIKKVFQIKGLYENNAKDQSCNFLDFIKPLAFSLWDSGQLRDKVLEELGIKSEITTLPELSDWLKKESPDHKGILNLQLVTMLEYIKRTTHKS